MSGIEKESGMRTQLIIVGLFLVVASCGGGGDDGPGMVDSAPATDVLDGRTAVPLDGRLQEVVGDVLIVPDGEGFDVTADTLADSQPDASVDLLADAHIDTFLDGGSELPEEVCDEFDEDCDGVPDDDDNCPALANLEQEDFDDDELGDVCDTDDDADGVEDVDDAFPLDPAEWSDVDGDGIGDNADAEECDGVDNDCDGLVDDEVPVTWWYPDADGDGRRCLLICDTMAGDILDAPTHVSLTQLRPGLWQAQADCGVTLTMRTKGDVLIAPKGGYDGDRTVPKGQPVRLPASAFADGEVRLVDLGEFRGSIRAE